MFQQNNFTGWFGLHLIRGVGNYTHRNLRSVSDNPDTVFSMERKNLEQILPRVEPEVIRNILKGPDLNKVYKHLDFCRQNGIQIISMDSPLYPQNLKIIANPPPYLYVKGTWPMPANCIAVVGTRSPSQYGLKVTQKMVRGLVGHQFTVVSGMARGIDTIAHKETLDWGGNTVAVLGRGFGFKTSAFQKPLHKQIIEKGALISELPLDKPADKTTFPLRNRIISALSLGTLIIEAGEKSGALITATYARQQKKNLFAFPGSVFNPKSRGTNNLIRGGAELVTHPDHIAVNFLPRVRQNKSTIDPPHSQISRPPVKNPHTLFPGEHNPPIDNMSDFHLNTVKKVESLSKNEKEILGFLKCEMNLDQLREVYSGARHGLLTILLTLESKGLIQRKPGSIYGQV